MTRCATCSILVSATSNRFARSAGAAGAANSAGPETSTATVSSDVDGDGDHSAWDSPGALGWQRGDGQEVDHRTGEGSGSSPRFPHSLATRVPCQRNPDFHRLWNEGDVDVLTERSAHFDLDVPEAGAMAFDVVAMIPPDRHRLFFVTLLPADGKTRARLATLARRRERTARVEEVNGGGQAEGAGRGGRRTSTPDGR